MNSNMYTVRLVIDHIICNRIRALLTVNLLASQIELHCCPFFTVVFCNNGQPHKKNNFSELRSLRFQKIPKNLLHGIRLY